MPKKQTNKQNYRKPLVLPGTGIIPGSAKSEPPSSVINKAVPGPMLKLGQNGCSAKIGVRSKSSSDKSRSGQSRGSAKTFGFGLPWALAELRFWLNFDFGRTSILAYA